MRAGRGGRILDSMRKPSRHTLTLELELDGAEDADAIAGRLSDSAGHGTDFVGWLGLASAIETLAGSPALDDANARDLRLPRSTPCQRP